jgi:hypothetical protein
VWLWDRLTTDSAVVYSGITSDVLTGLSHLEGEEVWALTGGMIDGVHTVSGGQITVNFGGTVADPIEAEVGLMFTPEATTVRPDISGVGGETIQGKEVSWNKLVIRLFETLNGKINDTTAHPAPDMETRRSGTSGDAMDASPPLFTGDFVIDGPDLVDEEERHGRINIKQETPLPITVLGYFGELNVN